MYDDENADYGQKTLALFDDMIAVMKTYEDLGNTVAAATLRYSIGNQYAISCTRLEEKELKTLHKMLEEVIPPVHPPVGESFIGYKLLKANLKLRKEQS